MLEGRSRVILYLTAAQTGFRAPELASITPACCFLGASLFHVKISRRISKRRKYDVQQIQPELADILREFIADKEEDE